MEHQGTIMVCGADLQFNNTVHPDGSVSTWVRVGNEMARVCRKAAQIARTRPDMLVFMTAGWSPKYRVYMGAGPVRAHLISCGIPEERIRTPVADTFNTDGEMRTLVEHLPESGSVLLVCRWWHLPRAWLLLRSHLSRDQRKRMEIVPVPVWTFRDWAMVLEPLAWLKNVRQLLKAF